LGGDGGEVDAGLIEKMTAKYPSMAIEWIDDRIRALATIYLLKYEKPDLLLLHLIDHDSEAHETGPFSVHAKAMVERTDELLGDILAAKPADMAVALVSDHGFERFDEVVNIRTLVKGNLNVSRTMVTTDDPVALDGLRALRTAREIPAGEWRRFFPDTPKPLGAFETPPHQVIRRGCRGSASAKVLHGDHGLWPLRPDYRSTFVLWTPGGKAVRLGEVDMLSLAGRLAQVLNVDFGKEQKVQ
jgi:hypothetical protein